MPIHSPVWPINEVNEPRHILRFPAVAALTGLGRTSIYRLMREGTFPQAVLIGGGPCTGWDSDAVKAWVAKQLGDK